MLVEPPQYLLEVSPVGHEPGRDVRHDPQAALEQPLAEVQGTLDALGRRAGHGHLRISGEMFGLLLRPCRREDLEPGPREYLGISHQQGTRRVYAPPRRDDPPLRDAPSR